MRHTLAPFRIAATQRETADVFTVDLEPPDGGPFDALPGQFNMLYAFAIGEAPISISGDPGKRDSLRHTIRAVGPVTQAFARARKGDTIGVRGPFGAPWPMETAEGGDLILIAGGIGLAPLRPALLQALSRRERYGRLVLLYGARTPGDLLFRRELEFHRRRFDLQIEVTVDRAEAGAWSGNVGPVTTLVPRAGIDPARVTAFVCGPELMIRYVIRSLAARGVPGGSIHVSLERNMKCAVGLCGHCQLGPAFVCVDGPVFPWPAVAPFLEVAEL